MHQSMVEYNRRRGDMTQQSASLHIYLISIHIHPSSYSYPYQNSYHIHIHTSIPTPGPYPFRYHKIPYHPILSQPKPSNPTQSLNHKSSKMFYRSPPQPITYHLPLLPHSPSSQTILSSPLLLLLRRLHPRHIFPQRYFPP